MSSGESQRWLRKEYGRNPFGQGCLLARRLVERGVSFVEVSLNGVPSNPALGWDTHQNNFDRMKQLSGSARSSVGDLDARSARRAACSIRPLSSGWESLDARRGSTETRAAITSLLRGATVLAGGGIRGGQVIGRTSDDGMTIEDRPVSVGDLMATIYRGLDLRSHEAEHVERRSTDPFGRSRRKAGRGGCWYEQIHRDSVALLLCAGTGLSDDKPG